MDHERTPATPGRVDFALLVPRRLVVMALSMLKAGGEPRGRLHRKMETCENPTLDLFAARISSASQWGSL